MKLEKSSINIGITACIYIAYSLCVLCSLDCIFFWDTVQLGSKHAHHYFDFGFREILLPDEIDSGHIPIFGMYLASCWVVFGKSLFVSHLSMLPFVLGIVNQVIYLCRKLFDASYVVVATCIILAQPTLVAQCSLISPDVVLIFAFLGMINQILNERQSFAKYGFAILLGCISMRGATTLFGIFLWECYTLYCTNKRYSRVYLTSVIYPYLSSFVLFFFYMAYHFLSKGWIGYHEGSPWALSFGKVDVLGFLRNILIFGWRMADFGMWIIILCAIYLILVRRKESMSSTFFALGIILFFISGYSFLVYTGLQGHRYLLPLNLVVIMFVLTSICRWKNKPRNFISILFFLSLMTGHFWMYPKGISQGWDASLAHRPYLFLWRDMMEHIDDQQLNVKEIGTAFPNVNSIENMSLNDRQESFKSLNIGTDKYILYSSIYNDVSKDQLSDIKQKYQHIYTSKSQGVEIVLFGLK